MRFFKGSWTLLPSIRKVLKVARGPILELGSGVFSTNMIFMDYPERDFVTCDNNAEWLGKIDTPATVMKVHVKDWRADLPSLLALRDRWGLVIVDFGPTLRDNPKAYPRWEAALLALPHAEYVICHDTEEINDPGYGYSKLWPHVKFRYDDTLLWPPTSIISNCRPCDRFLYGNKQRPMALSPSGDHLGQERGSAGYSSGASG